MGRFESVLRDNLDCAGMVRCGVLAGVSGGADSMALLRGLVAVRGELSLRVIAGHVDHGLRAESAEDAAWVVEQCAAQDVAIDVRKADVIELARQSGHGIEETARRARYDLLTTIALEHDCRFVAVAHSADDQAETILHHLIRGTGLAGLRGMPRERELGRNLRLIRPLLQVRREELRRYLAEIGQESRNDASNTDPAFTRNRIRTLLLPVLREEFNPRVEAALLRLGEQAGEWQEIIENFAVELLDAGILDAQADHVRIECAQLERTARPLVREALKQLWERQGWPRGQMSFEHWRQLAELVFDPVRDSAVQLPGGVDARRRAGLLVISRPSVNHR